MTPIEDAAGATDVTGKAVVCLSAATRGGCRGADVVCVFGVAVVACIVADGLVCGVIALDCDGLMGAHALSA